MTLETAVESIITRLDGLRRDGEVEWDRENLPAFYPSKVPVAWTR